MKFRNLRTIFILFILLAIGGTMIASAQSGLTFFITDVDASTFPEVQFNLRAVELGNKEVSNLNAASVSVFENGELVSGLEVTPHTDGAVTYILLIDQGRLANFTSFGLNNIRQAITTLVSGGYFVDERDTILVLGRQNINSDQTVELLPPTSTATELTTWAANFNFDRGRASTKGLLGIEDAVQQMNNLMETPGSHTTAILYLTRYIEDPSAQVAVAAAQNTAASALNSHTSIYTLQTDLSQTRKDALQILADGSGGQYAALDRNNFFSAVSSVFQAIDAQRTYYTLVYQSPSAVSGRREITINAPEKPGDGVIGNYEITLEPPSVSIVEPVSGSSIRREASYEGEEDNQVLTYEITRIRVVADVTWPDGFPREIQTAELFANGNLEDSVEIAPGQTQFEFEWDVSNVINPGPNAVQLEVNIEDELGLIAEAEGNINIDVIPPPTPEATGIQLPPALLAIGLPVLCIMGLATVGVIGGGIYFLRRKPAAKEAVPEFDPLDSPATIMGMDLIQAYLLATLTVTEGPSGLINEVMKIYSQETSIGRDPGSNDIAFYAGQESSISRSHCRIEMDENNNFNLIDQNSTVGTRLNGRQIKPEEPILLADNDEIVLGDLARRGVKLIFNFASENNTGGLSGSADDRTHYFGEAPDFGDPAGG
jgi:hypothetical protein